MSVMGNILLRMFGRPQGALGRLGGIIMARTNAECGAWVTELLEILPTESVLEVGFGPGIAIQRLSNLAGHVAGIDPSREMVRQARARNVGAIAGGRLDLRYGSVQSLPFDSDAFDKAIAINLALAGPRRRITRDLPSSETRRQDRARIYSLFGAAERGIDKNTHRRRLYRGAHRAEKHQFLCAGRQTVTVSLEQLARF
jgi:SAM-dependent methyltransferase